VNFVKLTSNIADMNALTSDEYARVLTWMLQYRSEAIELEECRINSLRSALKGTEAKIKELEGALAAARSAGQDLHNRCVSRAKDIDMLEKENAQLKAALAEARAAVTEKVTIALGEICRMAHDHKDRQINFIKAVRNSDTLIVDSKGGQAALRFVKEVCEAVAAVEGTSFPAPNQHAPGLQMNTACSYGTLRREVNFLAMKFYPNYQIEILD
jgi:hypothetical protein